MVMQWHRGLVVNLLKLEPTNKDGALFLSETDGEGSVYLYPEQVAHLKEILKNI